MNMSDSINLSVDVLVEKINAIKTIDQQITERKGTAAERKAKAETAVREDKENAKLVANIAKLRQQLEQLEGEFSSKVDDILRTSQDGAVLDGLKAQRATLVEEADAFRKVLEAFKVDVSAVEVPGKAPRTTGGSGSAKVSGSRFYRVEDGQRLYYAKDNLSGMAWYGFNNCGAETLKKAIAAAGVSEMTKPWEADVTVGETTRRIGMEVLGTETTN